MCGTGSFQVAAHSTSKLTTAAFLSVVAACRLSPTQLPCCFCPHKQAMHKMDISELMPPPYSLLHAGWMKTPSTKKPKQSCRCVWMCAEVWCHQIIGNSLEACKAYFPELNLFACRHWSRSPCSSCGRLASPSVWRLEAITRTPCFVLPCRSAATVVIVDSNKQSIPIKPIITTREVRLLQRA